ncbi:hypothetical protein [Microvirga puerhi]|uniref:Uncharacterized protein n=1 Tax=Microvirga puerhi TaxID=2876078 RepID=A0ABS7VT95_9HYPH|nr:hypothetical protein [Microvirga puerhi]MBZ6078784.1 hypothetical protein [Microvirga puerhi]
MNVVRISVLTSTAFILSTLSSFAGPCATAIDRVQAQLDARIDATAGVGPAARESSGALLHHQPTPGSIAGAEQKLGEGKSLEVAVASLSRAREADKAGNKEACDQALAEAQRAIAP